MLKTIIIRQTTAQLPTRTRNRILSAPQRSSFLSPVWAPPPTEVPPFLTSYDWTKDYCFVLFFNFVKMECYYGLFFFSVICFLLSTFSLESHSYCAVRSPCMSRLWCIYLVLLMDLGLSSLLLLTVLWTLLYVCFDFPRVYFKEWNFIGHMICICWTSLFFPLSSKISSKWCVLVLYLKTINTYFNRSTEKH